LSALFRSINFPLGACRHNPNSGPDIHHLRATALAQGVSAAGAQSAKRSAVPRLAIVISAVGSIEQLELTLLSVLENRPADCEIIVALNRAYTDPYDLKGEVTFLAPVRGSVIRAINAALAVTRAPFVHLLASGCQVSDGWADAALARFCDKQVASVAPLVLNADDPNRVLATGVGYRPGGQRYLVGEGTPASDARSLPAARGPALFAAFYRKAALEFVGGFSTELGPRQADVDLALVLSHAGLRTALEPGSRVSAATAADATSGVFREALYDERLFWRNLDGAPRLAAWLGHAALVGGEAIKAAPRPSMLARLAARSWAGLQWGAYARHHRLLAELTARSLPSRGATDNLRFDRSHGAPARREADRSRARAS
jgi:hypothetical protein